MKKTEWKIISRPGGWFIGERIAPDGKMERRRLMCCESDGKFWVKIQGHSWCREIRADRDSETDTDFSGLVAQFPAKVRKVLVQTGSMVKRGDRLVLLEAMKMEFAIKAPCSGSVTKIHVKSGQQLLPGDRFISFL